jgi:hypothetical protein
MSGLCQDYYYRVSERERRGNVGALQSTKILWGRSLDLALQLLVVLPGTL